MSDDTGPKLAYSVPNAAKALDISRSTMWQLVADGKIETFKLGSRTLIDAEDLGAFVKSIKPKKKRAA